VREKRIEVVEEMAMAACVRIKSRGTKEMSGAYRYVTPRDERMRTLCRFLGPSDDRAPFSPVAPLAFDSDLYTAAILSLVVNIWFEIEEAPTY